MHLVQYSTGLSSAEVAWRLTAEHGPGAVVCLTADTLREHPDNWRFAAEVVNRLGCEWVRLTDGRTPMQVGRDRKCVPSNRMAVCSQILKRELLRRYMDTRYDPARDTVYVGYDWSEPHRLTKSQEFWAPWAMRALLAEPPYATPLEGLFRSRGIEPPELYKYRLGHANCGGFCVRAGQAQWSLMLQVDPCGYREWEAEEEQTRAVLGKNVSILRDRYRGKRTVPVSLRTFRERLERQPAMFDEDDWGACGCDMDSPPPPPEPRDRIPKVERWTGTEWIPIHDS
jgi:hypothetical protein